MKIENEKLKEINNYLQEKKIAIIGIDYNNTKLVEYLCNIQADEVVVFDKREIEKINGDMMDKVITCGMEYCLGEDCLKKLEGFDIIFRSLDYLPTIPEIVAEDKQGTIITTWLELFMQVCPATIIGVAGTDGKLTTVAMIYEILKSAEYNVYIGGDEETFLLSKIEDMTEKDFVILKLTNKQLMKMQTSPKVAVVTNLNLDDLEIEYDKEEYVEALRNIFLEQGKEDLLILNSDSQIVRRFALSSKARVFYFGENKLDEGYVISDNKIKVCQGELRIHLLDGKNLIVRGSHNLKNVACSLMATMDYVDLEVALEVIKTFYALENRLELIYESKTDRITCYNDSASITPTRTITALDAFALKNVILIAGGDKNELDYKKIAEPIINATKTLILNGENADLIEELVNKKLRWSGKKLPIYKTENLEESVKLAKKLVSKGDVILFSPGSNCLSEYESFEERGKKFKKIIQENF